MEFTGKIQNVSKDWNTGKINITFTVNEPAALGQLESIQNCEKLSIKAVRHRNKRSLDANGMLWACIGDIAKALKTDKWKVYLEMLKRYGKFTYICVKPNVVDAVKAQWRECEVIGEVEVGEEKTKAVQMLCYFGSSTYDSKEFSDLLDGVVSEMKEMGLSIPTSEDMKRAIQMCEEARK